MTGRIKESIGVDHNEGNLGDLVERVESYWGGSVAAVTSGSGKRFNRGSRAADFGAIFEVAYVQRESDVKFGAGIVKLRNFNEKFRKIFG